METIQNRVQLIGRVGQEPEIINLESGKKIAKFNLATHESFINKEGQRIQNTHWHSIIFWDKPAEIIERFVSKGQQIAVEGKLTTQSWEDESGKKLYRTKILGTGLLLLGK